MDYQYTNNWFQGSARRIWDSLIPRINPSRILEIGSYEGASTCYLIEKVASLRKLEIHCVDTWEGGIEHSTGGFDMSAVERRFSANVRKAMESSGNEVNLTIHKGFSDVELCKLMASGKQSYFDLVYVDGSHQAPDVLCDALLAFRLLRKSGVMIFDDYLWQESLPHGVDPLRCPKPAIDAFTNMYCRKLRVLSGLPLGQLYVVKLSD